MMHSENTKRERPVDLEDIVDQFNTKMKVPNLNKTGISDFTCPVVFSGKTFHFQLSSAFNNANFVILFFCPYDFTPQSKDDLLHIEEHYSKFVRVGALPIAVTHDRPDVHLAYAMPGKTPYSLTFSPSFALASDSMNRLISTSFKSINLDTFEMIRSVVIIDRNLHVSYTHQVPERWYFPMKAILNCFE